MGERERWLVGTVIALAGLVIALLAWLFPRSLQTTAAPRPNTSVTTPSSPQRSPRADPGPSARKVAFNDVHAGECLTGPGAAKIVEPNSNYFPDYVEVVPCNSDHIAEVFFATTGISKSQANSDTLCDRSFKAYTDIWPEDSMYAWGSFSTQDVNGYDLQCFAYNGTNRRPWYKTLSRSLKGIRK